MLFTNSLRTLLTVAHAVAFVRGQESACCDSTTTITSTVFASSTLSTFVTSTTPTPSATGSSGTVIVDANGNGQFTAINSAISYAQVYAQPTVIVRAGTYNEAVVVLGSASLTIVGETTSSLDYNQNQVTITNPTLPLSIGTSAVKGISWRNINFVNNAQAGANNPAVSLRGTKNAFYNCKFISSGATAITSTLGITLIANSYIEGTDKLFYGYNGLYIFGSTIAATASSGNIVYAQSTGALQYSQTVFDSCSIVQKPGTSNSYVYLAAANGANVQVVYKYSTIASLIAPSGTRAVGANGFFGEYGTSGPGSFGSSTSRLDTWMTSSMLSNYTIDYVFANSFAGYTTPSLSWIDSSVLQAIAAANTVILSPTSSSSTLLSSSYSSTSSSSLSPTSVMTSWTTSYLSNSTANPLTTTTSFAGSSSTDLAISSSLSTTPSSVSTSQTSASSTVATPACSLPASVPSSALVVGPSGSCAKFTSLVSAIAALPQDYTAQYIYLLAGTYNEQVASFSRPGQTIFRGESASPLDQSANTVIIQYSGSVLSSAGGSEEKSVFRSTQYNAKKYAFYNIDFVNTAVQTANYIAIAMDIKAQQVGFYSCGFTSGQGTFLANYGTMFMTNCRIEGSSDFFWGYGAAYISNSQIISNAPGYSIAAQSYVAAYPSGFVFDQCAFIPKQTTSMQQSTYLGRDYSASARVAVTNSFLDGHISPAGWLVRSASSNVAFAEFNNTGPGYVDAARVSQVQKLSDASAYSLSSILGDISWIDMSAVVPFKGFPASVFVTSPVSTTSSASTPASSTSSTSVLSSPTATIADMYVVSQQPNTTEYGTISAAVAALPSDGRPKTIFVKAGVYIEQVVVNRAGKVTIQGETPFLNDYSQNKVTVQFNYGVSTSAGQNELTPVINSKKTDGSGLALYNINFVNTFPQTRNYAALAADFYGDNMAAYGCSFVGFQDTLLANKGTQLFSNCYIEGSVDYVWGFSTAYFHGCYLATNTPGTAISAQSRSSLSAPGGYIFDSCYVTYTKAYGTSMGMTALGRPYSQYSIAIYKNSFLDQHISSAGWQVWQTSNPQTDNVMFGEYNNFGPGAWTTSSNRVPFATNLTASQVAKYDLGSVFSSTSWIDMDAYNYTPSFNLTRPNPGETGTVNPPLPSNSTTIRPTNGANPPTGSITVSVGGVQPGSFSNLTAALASLPQDSSNQTIFIYNGTYVEQYSVNRPGPITIIGQQAGDLGKGFAGNLVTISFSRGLSVAVAQPGHTNAETAVIATASNQISVYNVNFVNTDNSDGEIPSYVTLAASVYGDKNAFYGCSFIGWQDTLLTGNTGAAYYESCYIEGAIDFIWGYGLSYFKGCTMGAKKAKSSVTAHNRPSATANGGYIFDQCLFTSAPSLNTDLTQAVYLGRPYSRFARVVIKNSYLDSIIQPSGWKIWSATDPRIDGATFAEYQNVGPGNWENNAAARLAFGNATLLTSDTYSLNSVMASTSWIDMTHWSSIVTPQPAVVVTPPPVPANSTTPVEGACIVSKTQIAGKTTFNTISGCISSLPATSALATIFIYPGVYNEKIVFNRSGATIFRGYSDSPNGYTTNQVSIVNAAGVDTQADQSNSDSATFYSRGKNVKFYNINLVNNFGTAQNYASLAFAVANNGFVSFYDCQVIGNQDTLFINTGANLFMYNSYVEGSVDFIYGSGSAYFLGTDLAPNTNGVSITADKRATNTSIGGMVFDQCRVTPSASGQSNPKMAGSISLGRPWNQYARVAYIKTFLDSSVSPAGWVRWSASTPNTDGVFFGEYQNTGPGSSRSGRAIFSHEMSDAEVSSFQLSTFFASTSWIDTSALAMAPFSPGAPAVTITSTIYPTQTGAVVTSTSTVLSVVTMASALSTVTKNVTEKVSMTLTMTEPDVYLTKLQTITTTSIATVIPDPKYTTTTRDERVFTTLTIQGSETTQTQLKTSKVTATVTFVAPDVTRTTINTIVAQVTETSTPKDVVRTIFLTEVMLTTTLLTPQAKSITQTSITTVSQQITAPTPTSIITRTSIDTIIESRINTPKPVTRTTLLDTTIPAGPTVTIKAKATTSYVTITSTAFKTVKKTTTLSCIPSVNPRRRSEGPLFKRADSPSTITVLYTVPVSTSTYILTTNVTSTTVLIGGKFTQTDTYTSYISKTAVVDGQTFTALATTTKVIPKTTTLPQATSVITAVVQGTEVQTKPLPGRLTTSTEIVYSTVKTTTFTIVGKTAQATLFETLTSTTKTTLQASTVQVTSLSTETQVVRSVLPTPTVVVSVLNTIVEKSTITPAVVSQTLLKLTTTTMIEITTLEPSTNLVTRTNIVSREPTPTVTLRETVVKNTTVKSTSTVYSTATKTAKGAPTCA